MKKLQYSINNLFEITDVAELTDQAKVKFNVHIIDKTASLFEILQQTIQNNDVTLVFDDIHKRTQTEFSLFINKEKIGVIDRKNKSKNIQINSCILPTSECYQIVEDINSFTLYKRIFNALIKPYLIREHIKTKLISIFKESNISISDINGYLYLNQPKYSKAPKLMEVKYNSFEFKYDITVDKLSLVGIIRDDDHGDFTEQIQDLDIEIANLQKDKEILLKLTSQLTK